jgi:hypothetical protein
MTVSETPVVERTVPDIMVLPKAVERMISARQEFQVMKFRTTCTDCVPNF